VSNKKLLLSAYQNKINFQKRKSMKLTCLKLALFLLLLSGAIISHAQKIDSKWIAEISIGPSFPFGKYKSKDYKDSTAGFAKTGIGASISFGYRLSDRISVHFMAGEAQNKQDEEPMAKRMDGFSYGSYRTEVHTKNWNTGKLMLGAGIQLPLCKSGKFSSVSKLSAGVCKTAIPAFSGETYSNNNVPGGTFSSGKIPLAWTFCYQINSGINMQLSERIYALTDFSYFNGRPVYHTQRNYTLNPGGPFTPVDIKYSLASFNIQAGAGIRF
jgi:hypothetical protein